MYPLAHCCSCSWLCFCVQHSFKPQCKLTCFRYFFPFSSVFLCFFFFVLPVLSVPVSLSFNFLCAWHKKRITFTVRYVCGAFDGVLLENCFDMLATQWSLHFVLCSLLCAPIRLHNQSGWTSLPEILDKLEVS